MIYQFAGFENKKSVIPRDISEGSDKLKSQLCSELIRRAATGHLLYSQEQILRSNPFEAFLRMTG
jgi:hypothetical protein